MAGEFVPESMMQRLVRIVWRHNCNAMRQGCNSRLRIVLRGFGCVSEFFRVLRSHDLRSAKTSFIPTFIDELKEKSGPEVTHLIEEAENLLIDRQGWVLIGVFPTGGNFNERA